MAAAAAPSAAPTRQLLFACAWGQLDVAGGRYPLEALPALLDRYKYADRHPQATAAQWRDAAVELLLAPLEAGLQRGRFLLGVRCSLADISLLPFVRQFAAVDSAWFEQASLPHLRRWLADGVTTPLFQAVMQKQQVWREALKTR